MNIYLSVKSICDQLSRKQYKWIFFLLCIIFPLFFYGGPAYDSSRLLDEFWNFGHFLYFGLFTLLFDNYLWARKYSGFTRVGLNIGVLLFAGITIELVQLCIAGRIFSWFDVIRDVSGGSVVLCWRMSVGSSMWMVRFLKVLVTGLLLLNLWPIGTVAFDEYSAYKSLPLLAGFESGYELKRWVGDARLSRNDSVAIQGEYSAKIELTTKLYSGVALHYFPGDWSGWRRLVFSVYNPGLPLELHFRVHDNMHTGDNQKYDNRFNGSIVLHNGWNEVSVPLVDILRGPRGRQIDLTEIKGFGIFVMNQTKKRTIYLDNVCLK